MIWCDNNSMVKKGTAHRTNLTDLFPNKTLEADFDVIAELWSTVQGMPVNSQPSFSHVKGHQDAKKPYEELSLEAQLNVDADRLADQYLQAHQDKNYNTAPLLPTTGAQLHLRSGTVNSKIKRELRLARTIGPLREKLCTDNGWSEETFDSIDWEAHRLALNRLNKHHVTLVKHLNNVTPVGRFVHRYNIKYPKDCPSCNTPEETRKHLYRCPAPSREAWRRDCKTNLRKLMQELDTHPELMDLLLEGLHAVLYGLPTGQIPVRLSVETVAAAQTAIRWDQLLKGRLAKAWQLKQQAHLGNRSTEKKNGRTWATSISTKLLQQWWDLWTLRNQDRHGKDFQSREDAQHRQALREITQLYEHKDNLPQQLQWLLQKPLQQCLQWPTYMIVAFINAYKPIIEGAMAPPAAPINNGGG